MEADVLGVGVGDSWFVSVIVVVVKGAVVVVVVVVRLVATDNFGAPGGPPGLGVSTQGTRDEWCIEWHGEVPFWKTRLISLASITLTSQSV